MFGQTFDARDLFVIGLLVVLEGVLSIDNALVLGLLAKRLPRRLQAKALTYGLAGAFVFRVIAIATASALLRWRVVKLVGGAYLMYVSLKHFFFDADEHASERLAAATAATPPDAGTTPGVRAMADPSIEGDEHEPAPVGIVDAAVSPFDRHCAHCDAKLAPEAKVCHGCGKKARKVSGFWSTVAVIELTDIAFAIDSILAAIALVGSPPIGTASDAPHPKLWVVVTGGMLGVILMRLAAVLFIRLLERFPRFETAAYLLVMVIGLKLIVDWAGNSEAHPNLIDFHDWREPEFWAFWVAMLVCFAIGFIPRRAAGGPAPAPAHPPPAPVDAEPVPAGSRHP